MDKSTLQLIANGEYDYNDQTQGIAASAGLSHSDCIQQFDDACHVAAKIIGRSQDRESRARIGSLLKIESRKKILKLDARRFTTPIPMRIFTPDDEELYGRVTVGERFGRSTPQNRFHTLDYGSVAVKLFLFTSERQEQEMHLAVCQRTGDDIRTQIDGMRSTRGRGLGHILQLLELTRASLG